MGAVLIELSARGASAARAETIARELCPLLVEGLDHPFKACREEIARYWSETLFCAARMNAQSRVTKKYEKRCRGVYVAVVISTTSGTASVSSWTGG